MEKIIKSSLSNLKSESFTDIKNVFKPRVFNMAKEEELEDLELFISSNNKQLIVHNSIEAQVLELYKIDNPGQKPSQKELEDYWHDWQLKRNPDFYGVWVHYPWSNKLVHLLPEEEFVRLRTSRNQYKIHPEEQALLASKTIGLIGLSVGQSVALTLSMERVYGTLRIADFDHLDLSNLNRIRSGVHNLGLAKTTMVAREIAEIDPFLKVEVYDQGITDTNLDDFIGTGAGKLDLLIEECDALDIKIKARLKARAAGVPVIMDTSDRGMMDIERFDLEPKRPLMHGMVKEEQAQSVDQWTAKERLALVMDMVGAENISARLKSSLLEVEESLTTWPQLASSVTLGGAISTAVARRILLGQDVDSGRYYLDLDQLYSQKESKLEQSIPVLPEELSFEQCRQMLENLELPSLADALEPSSEDLEDLVSHACLAPSGGNTQPWKWIWYEGKLALFHDQHFSQSFLDYRHRGSYVGLGAAMENLEQRAHHLGYQAHALHSIKNWSAPLIAVYRFNRALKSPLALQGLGDRLSHRLTSRNRSLDSKAIPNHLKEEVNQALIETSFKMKWVEDPAKMDALAQIIGKVERQRILDPWGHYDFINEARWTKEQAESTRNGVDLRTLPLTDADKVGFKLIQDAEAIRNLRFWDKGKALVKMSTDGLKGSSALALLYTDQHDIKTTLEGGKLVNRIWLYLNDNGVSYQPVSPATFMFARLAGEDESTSAYLKAELRALRSEYLDLLDLESDCNDLFLCRLFFAEEPKVKSLRKPVDLVYKNLMNDRA